MHFRMIWMMFLHKNKRRAPALQNNMQLVTTAPRWLTDIWTRRHFGGIKLLGPCKRRPAGSGFCNVPVNIFFFSFSLSGFFTFKKKVNKIKIVVISRSSVIIMLWLMPGHGQYLSVVSIFLWSVSFCGQYLTVVSMYPWLIPCHGVWAGRVRFVCGLENLECAWILFSKFKDSKVLEFPNLALKSLEFVSVNLSSSY